MTRRLLLVEPSATMRYVLDKHARSLGFDVQATESYQVAVDALQTQYRQFGAEFGGLLFGWPIASQDDAALLASLLEQPSFRDLPVVVMSTDMRAETRAWAADREGTSLLPWKDYQGLEGELQKLIEADADDTAALPRCEDNSDIHLLVVDDSATIRYSLRDLFQLQGYRVSLAATQLEAMQLARADAVDIAILDYYLTETTGDLLCRDLMSDAATGDVVCTVLTGTYSDHIIKRSLRAGALECMFKNESSELLLSRIDALSRFVRQGRRLRQEQTLLQQIVESLVGAVLVLDSSQHICHVNDAGLHELGLASRDALMGQPGAALLERGGPRESADGKLQAARWRLPDGAELDVDYEWLALGDSGRSLIRFVRASMEVGADKPLRTDMLASSQEAQGIKPSAMVGPGTRIHPSATAFLQQMRWYLGKSRVLSDRTSLMVLDVRVSDTQAENATLQDYPDLQKRIQSLLEGIYKRPAHVAQLADARFGFLLRHREESHVYVLARKIMQMCLELDTGSTSLSVNCAGSLLSLVDKEGHSRDALLVHAFKGVELAAARGDNQILLMDMRRMLSAYPAQENAPQQ